MTSLGPKTISVTAEGEPDGFEPPLAWYTEMDPTGSTRIVVSTPQARLIEVHLALLDGLRGPMKVLYRQSVDRLDPKPAGAPPRDFVALDLPKPRVLAAIRDHAELVWHDGRHQLWAAGAYGEQVVLDEDGVLYCYPDDPSFRDRLDALGIPHVQAARTMADVDYPKRWYHADNDAVEASFVQGLGLTEVPHRGA
ncbi:MAG: hypothetical protein ACI8PZ_005893 [Myxococcota bacterium]|jgi:hypothetical protein